MKNQETAASLLNKITTNERIHKEESAVRNGAREMAKKVSINIPKLRDCKYHLNSYPKSRENEALSSMIFLTEGDSASGTITKTRNVDTQAVFSLRGKPYNVFGKTRKAIYENEELYNIMVALGLENNDFDNLRYSKVVIATDADTDGFLPDVLRRDRHLRPPVHPGDSAVQGAQQAGGHILLQREGEGCHDGTDEEP